MDVEPELIDELKKLIKKQSRSHRENPLDAGLAEVMLVATNPQGAEAQSHFSRIHQDFTVIASILINMEAQHQARIKPLPETGQTLFDHWDPATNVAELIYKSATSGSGFLLEKILENLSPSLLRQSQPDPYMIPEPVDMTLEEDDHKGRKKWRTQNQNESWY